MAKTLEKNNYCTEEVRHICDKYNFTFKELCYRLKHDIPLDKEFTCFNCGKKMDFEKVYNSYIYCSRECALKSENRTNKILSTKEQKYGNKNYNNRDKAKQTCLDKYGLENYSLTKDFLDKFKDKEWVKNKSEKTRQTYQEKYGADHYTKTEEYYSKLKDINKKNRDTKLKKYGDEYYNNREKVKQTLQNKYGVDYYPQAKEFKKKIKQTYQKKYGVDHYTKTEEYKAKFKDEEWLNKRENKRKQTSLKKYGKEYYIQTKEHRNRIKQTCLKKYNSEYYITSKEFKNNFNDKEWVKRKAEKEYQTKKKNNSFNESKPEKHCLELAKTKYPNTIGQYKSDKYPFRCDLYIPEKDLYIELHFHWTHGKEPFDQNNSKHIALLHKMKSKNSRYYNSAIHIWTDLDVRKKNIAKENNLNFLAFYKEEDFVKWFNNLKD
ncbi:MAG: hypothetical protein NC222_06260 [Staphylococcus sp.]|nr:hypothetical protein [Staphylococcus sp.]